MIYYVYCSMIASYAFFSHAFGRYRSESYDASDSGVSSALIFRQQSVLRNKRCLLAYMCVRARRCRCCSCVCVSMFSIVCKQYSVHARLCAILNSSHTLSSMRLLRNYRTDKIESMRHDHGSVLPPEIRAKMHSKEQDYFKSYDKILADYMAAIDFDLTAVSRDLLWLSRLRRNSLHGSSCVFDSNRESFCLCTCR